jgi:peptidoglycan/LPS O-acetylase OafA/YrhL
MGARWVYENKRSWFEAREFTINLPIALGLLFPGMLFLVFVERSAFYTHWVWFSTFDTIVGVLIVPALLVAAAGTLAPSRVNRLAEWAGQRSYGLYLWHFPVILVAYERGIAYAPPVLGYWWARIAFILVITAILAEVSYRAIEMPAQRWAKLRLQTVGRPS